MISALTHYDLFILACFFVDALGDALVGGTLLIFLSENLGFSDTARAYTLGLSGTATSLWFLALGGVLDTFPKRGPLGAIALSRILYTIPLCMLLLAHWLSDGLARFCVVLAALLGAAPLAVAVGSVGYALTIKRLGESRPPEATADVFTLLYAVGNGAALAAAGITTLLRGHFDPAFPAANLAALAMGAALSLMTAGVALLIHRKLFKDGMIGQPPPLVETLAHGAIAASSCQRLPAILYTRWFWRYMAFVVAMAGTGGVYYQMGATMPIVLIRQFGEAVYFPVVMSIDPAIVLVGTLLQPCLKLGSVPPLRMIVLGVLVQASAVLWPLFFARAEWAVVVFMVQFAIGEVMAMPRITDYVMRLLPKGYESRVSSLGQLPRIVAHLGQMMLSGHLLEAFCPSAAACGAESVAVIWMVIAAIAYVTPVVLLVLAARRVLPHFY